MTTDAPYKLPLCPNCGGEPVLYREINRNGANVITARCHRCNSIVNPRRPFLSKSEHPNWEQYPLYRDGLQTSEKCSVTGCDRRDTEFHHYAPQHLFDNADSWATGYLCSVHHREWHEKTKTGYFAKKKVTS